MWVLLAPTFMSASIAPSSQLNLVGAHCGGSRGTHMGEFPLPLQLSLSYHAPSSWELTSGFSGRELKGGGSMSYLTLTLPLSMIRNCQFLRDHRLLSETASEHSHMPRPDLGNLGWQNCTPPLICLCNRGVIWWILNLFSNILQLHFCTSWNFWVFKDV